MAQKVLLYLTAERLTAHSLARGQLALEASFACDDAGVAAFSAFVAGSRKLHYLVADLVEEDYQQDTIPALGRGDRRQVLARKLAQRYRDTDLALGMSLGFMRGERRNERVLYASFTNAQQFRPWLAALERAQCRLAGVYSAAQLAPALLAAAGLRPQRCLLVSVHQAGLRQSYVEDGKMRLSRVGRVNLEDAAALAAVCAAESAHMHQYLLTTRQLPRATTQIDVVVLAAKNFQAALARACRDGELLRFHLVDTDALCRAAGLKAFAPQTPCEALVLQALARAAPPQQFAAERHRRHYRLWQFSRGLYATGALMLAASLAFTGMVMLDARELGARLQADRDRAGALDAQYARVAAAFAPMPATAENLRVTLRQYALLREQEATPADLYAAISAALAGFAQVEIERIQWHAGTPAQAGGESTAIASAYAVVSARVVGVPRADLRTITGIASRFVATLERNPRLQLSAVRLPFSLAADDTLSGDIGAGRTLPEEADFDFTVAQRRGG